MRLRPLLLLSLLVAFPLVACASVEPHATPSVQLPLHSPPPANAEGAPSGAPPGSCDLKSATSTLAWHPAVSWRAALDLALGETQPGTEAEAKQRICDACAADEHLWPIVDPLNAAAEHLGLVARDDAGRLFAASLATIDTNPELRCPQHGEVSASPVPGTRWTHLVVRALEPRPVSLESVDGQMVPCDKGPCQTACDFGDSGETHYFIDARTREVGLTLARPSSFADEGVTMKPEPQGVRLVGSGCDKFTFPLKR